MSQAIKRRLQRLLRLLAEHGADITMEWTYREGPNSGGVRFLSKDRNTELSDWMAPTKAHAWAQGYLIGTGHKWANEMKL